MPGRREALRIQLLGGFTLSYDGEELPPLPSRHARLLLARLVLQGGRAEPRTLLCDRLWPDVPEARARRRLSHAMWQVQDAFGERGPDQPFLLTPGDTVAFDVAAPHWLDVQEFEQRLDDAEHADDVGAEVRHLRRCVELYRGDLLAGSYEPWVLDEQDRLRQRHVIALGRLVRACKQRGNFEEALVVARRLTHQAPLREDVHREVMRLCVLLGQPSQALEQFDRCRSVLGEELGTSPSAATVELRDRIAQSRNAGTSPRPALEELATRRLVGRDAERVRLVDQLERTLGGGGGMVFLEGEPGVGKTQLLVQTAEDARWRGFTVLWGSCQGRRVAYGAVRDALLPVLDPVRVAQLRAVVDAVWLQEAGRLLPPLRPEPSRATPGELTGDGAAERMLQALAEVVAGLASIDPVLFVLEDLHGADHESLALLRTLARHLAPGRLLVLCSFRDDDARQDPRVWEALRALDRDARPTRLLLEPLRVFETAGLLREALGTPEVPAAFAESVHRECGGNPLYVLELLRSLRDTGTLDAHGLERLADLAVPVTDGLRSLIRHRLELLAPGSLRVVEFGAVLGGEFAISTLQEGVGLDARAVTTALGELVRRNLLEIAFDTCRFTHAATRQVALDSLPLDRVPALHAAAADALAATAPDEVEALATHLQLAELPARALPYLRRAAERAVAIHAYDTAADHLQGAIELCDRVPLALDDRVDLLLRAEGVLDVLGRRAEQGDVLDQLERLVGGDAELATDVLVRRAIHLGHVDQLVEAATVAERAVTAVAAGDVPARGRALTALGQVLGWAGDNTRSAEVLDEAVGLLHGADQDQARARHALATALRFLQRFDAADAELTAALATARRADDQVGAVQALGALADLRAETGRTAEAVELYDQAVADARRIGYRHREGVSLVNLGTVRLIRREAGAALASYDEAAAVFRSLGNRRGAAIVQVNRAWLRHRWFGHDDLAEADADAAITYFRDIGALGQVAVGLETLGGVARRRGDTDTAGRLLAEGLAAARAGSDQRAEVQLLRGRAELALASKDIDAAGRVAVTALDRARGLDLTEFQSELAVVAALAATRRGDQEEATALVRVAARHESACAEPHRLHHRLALVAAERGDDDAMARHHRRAIELLEDALEDVGDEDRRDARSRVGEHAAIVRAGARHAPRTLELRMARTDAPRGRPLDEPETTTVAVALEHGSDTPQQRRSQLLSVLQQVREQGAEPTLGDLRTILDVSESTVRRDLKALRSAGHEAATRGSGTG